MKAYFILPLFLLFFNLKSHAYLVGGEFQLTELNSSGLYDVQLNLYVEAIEYARTPIFKKDQALDAYIYRKSDTTVMDILTLTKDEDYLIEYKNDTCRIAQASVNKITFNIKGGYQFSSFYNDSEGYYIVWDRCCRNASVSNIENLFEGGMVFYLHFPPIFDSNNISTEWSSPQFYPISGFYACINEPFFIEFGATDIDGDSLVYSMSDPLLGLSNLIVPKPSYIQPEPYQTVNWVSGIDSISPIPGSPPLNIDANSGLLTMTPSDTGLYAFAISCQEFRNGIKIGEVKREFQIYVSIYCEKNSPPKAFIHLPDNSIYDQLNGDTFIMYSDDLSCLDLLICDDQDNRNNERISVEVIPVNFTTNSSLVEEGDDKFVEGIGDTLKGWKICPPACYELADRVFVYDIIVKDDWCPIPKRDTIRFYLQIIVKPNLSPSLIARESNNQNELILHFYKLDTVIINFEGYDLDTGNLLTLSMKSEKIRNSDFGIEFPSIESKGGTINATFNWILDCKTFSNTNKERFEFIFFLDDNTCSSNHTDSLKVLILRDKEIKYDFDLPNVFTPNGDGINDVLLFDSLPRDNCKNKYEGFTIYNRFGKKIYQTLDRKVTLDGTKLNDGIYYYSIVYSNLTYKNWFAIIR